MKETLMSMKVICLLLFYHMYSSIDMNGKWDVIFMLYEWSVTEWKIVMFFLVNRSFCFSIFSPMCVIVHQREINFRLLYGHIYVCIFIDKRISEICLYSCLEWYCFVCFVREYAVLLGEKELWKLSIKLDTLQTHLQSFNLSICVSLLIE